MTEPQIEMSNIEETQGKCAGSLGLILMGFVIATWSAMCGIGGGLFAVPMLHYVCRIDLRRSVATGLALVAATTTSGTLSEILHAESRIEWSVVGLLVIGSLIGAQIGFHAAKRIQPGPLKVVFSVLLMFVGLEIVLSSGSSEVVVAGAFEGLGDLRWIFPLLIGLTAGIIAPVLGIGGGLVAVPALLFGLGDLGYLGARACSAAMGSVTSMRALWLYLKTNLIEKDRAIALAAGALVGAWAGVQLVHIDGVKPIARMMMGATLIFVSLRFGWDVFGKGRQKS